MDMIGDENLWDVARVGEFLGLRPFTVRSWVRIGRLPAVVSGRIIRFDPAEIRQWVKQYRRKPR